MSDRPEPSVQSLAACEIARGFRLLGAPVDADTMYFVLVGTMHMRLPSGRITAKPGSMVLVPPGQQPGIAPDPGAALDIVATRSTLMQRGGFLVFDAAKGASGDLRVLVGRVSGGLSDYLRVPGAPPRPVCVDLGDADLARSAFAALREELDAPGPDGAPLVAALMKTCLSLFVRLAGERGVSTDRAPATPASNRIGMVVAEIVSRPSAPHTLQGLARLAGMSRATFMRQFTKTVGTSPMEFLLKTRLHDAAGRLQATSVPIEQVAAESGFRSRSHFTRVFQAAFGSPPSAFRRGSGSERPSILAEDGVEHISDVP